MGKVVLPTQSIRKLGVIGCRPEILHGQDKVHSPITNNVLSLRPIFGTINKPPFKLPKGRFNNYVTPWG